MRTWLSVHGRRSARAVGAEPLYDRTLALARRISEGLRDRRWHRELGRVLRTGVQVTGAGSWASPGDGTVPVVVCLWNRPHRADDVIRLLALQESDVRIRLLLWNNNPEDAGVYAAAVERGATGALASIDLYDSPTNLGGVARFVAARLARNGGYRGPIVMLDDDQDIERSFVHDLLTDYAPRSVVAWWAFSQHGSYWRRAEISPGDHADHAGTGGTIYDSQLVADDRFFARLPRRFGFLEDQWMSFVAHRLGWRVVKARTTIALVSEELNQYHGLRPLKDEFYRYQTDASERLWRPSRRRRAWSSGRITSSVRD